MQWGRKRTFEFRRLAHGVSLKTPHVKLDSRKPFKWRKSPIPLIVIGNKIVRSTGPLSPQPRPHSPERPLNVQKSLKVLIVVSLQPLPTLQPPHKLPSGPEQTELRIVLKVEEQ